MPKKDTELHQFVRSYREGVPTLVTRRAFLQSSAALAVAAHAGPSATSPTPPENAPVAEQRIYLPHFDEDEQMLYELSRISPAGSDAFRHFPLPLDGTRLAVTRATDFLYAHFTFTNVTLRIHFGRPWLVRTRPDEDALVELHLPPQHLQEETFIEEPGGKPAPPPSAAPATPAELTASGWSSFTYSLGLQPHLRVPLTLKTLLKPIEALRSQGGSDGSEIEVPFRTIIRSAEDQTSYRQSELPAGEFGDTPPQLWHLTLESKEVMAAAVARSNNVVTLTLPTVAGWSQYQTIGILEPASLAGDYVIDTVDSANRTLSYLQRGANFTQNGVPLKLANRFSAVRALDSLPKVIGITSTASAVTLTFGVAPTIKVGEIVQLAEIVADPTIDGLYLVSAVTGSSLTYLLRAGQKAPLSCHAIIVWSFPCTRDSNDGTLLTADRTAFHPNENVFVFDAATGTSFSATVSSADVPSAPGGYRQTLSGPAAGALPAKAVLVGRKVYPVTGADRHDLVQRSSNPSSCDPKVPMAVDQLVFSALGAWFSAQATFRPGTMTPPCAGTTPSLEKYIYRMAQGRDYYVEVDKSGFLFPYGHEAVLLKITRRVFGTVETNVKQAENICFLRMQYFIVVRQKSRLLRTAPGHGQEVPFQQVDILNSITPALWADGSGDIWDAETAEPAEPGTPLTGYFWPAVAQRTIFSFDIRAFDGAEPRSPILFSQPLMFVLSDFAIAQPVRASNAYNNSNNSDDDPHTKGRKNTWPRWRQADMGGLSFHFADSIHKGDTQLHAGPLSFWVNPLTQDSTDPLNYQRTYVTANEPQVPVRPVLDWAAVDVPAIRVFSGNSTAFTPTSPPTAPASLTPQSGDLPQVLAIPAGYVKAGYDQLFVQHGFTESNPAEVFIAFDNSDKPKEGSHAALLFPGSSGGGSATPTSAIRGLSRSHGISNQGTSPSTPANSGTAVAANLGFSPGVDFETFSPLTSLQNFLNAELLGCVPLSDIIAPIADIRNALGQLPQLLLTNAYSLTSELTALTDIVSSVTAAVTDLKTVTGYVESQLSDATVALNKAVSDFAGSIVPAAVLTKDLHTATITCSPTFTNLQNLYDQAAKDLSQALSNIAVDVAKEVLLPNVKDLAGQDYELLRAAGDINLMTALWDGICTEIAQIKVVTTLTLDDLTSRLRSDFLNAAAKTLAKEQRPLDLLLQQVENFLDALNTVAADSDLTRLPDNLLNLRTQLAKLLTVTTRTFQQLRLGATPGKLNGDFYQAYYNDFLPALINGKRAETGMWGQLHSAITRLQGDVQNTVVAHRAAFSAVIKKLRTAHGLTLPDSVFKPFDDLLASAVTLDCVFDPTPVTSVIDSVRKTFAGLKVTDDTVLTQLNDALGKILGIEQQIESVIDVLDTPVSVSGTYTLDSIPLQDGPPGNAIFLAHNDDKPAYLSIDATVSASATPINPSSASADFQVKAGIYNFTLDLLPAASFITVAFNEFSYTASRSAGTHFTCKLASVDPVILDDALGYLATLASAFGPLGADDDDDDDGGEDEDSDTSGSLKPIIKVAGFGLTVGFELAFPNIEAGGFQMLNLAFSIALVISFGNDPLRLQFYFARPDKHFLMSASIYGGGGFLGLELRPDGVDRVQGALEFGACAGIDLGVASGEVHIFGGIYFDFGDQRTVLTGYVRAGGSLRIIQIITISLEFYLGLTYEQDKNAGTTMVYGDCTLTVSISILFFHADVSVHMHWEMAGSKTTKHSIAGQRREPNSIPDLKAARRRGTAHPLIALTAACGENNPRLTQWDQGFWDTYTSAFR